ncbi:hypothetical protein NPIL_424561, partial [Nephila pilipes]
MFARTRFSFELISLKYFFALAKKCFKDISSDEFKVATANDLIVGNTSKDKSSAKKYEEYCIFC